MATLATENFTGSNGAAWPAQHVAGQTGTGATATIQSNSGELASGLQGAYNGASRISRRYDITAPTDVDFSGTWNPDADEPYGAVFVRSDNAGDTQTGYYLLLNKSGTLSLDVIVAYSATSLGTISFAAASNTTYGFRLRAVGTLIQAKVWSGAEPGTWDISVTNSAVTGSGAVGHTVVCGNATVAHAIRFDDEVVTDGATGTATPPTHVMSATKPAPTITASATVTATTIAKSATFPTPTITRTATVAATTKTMSATVFAPTVNTSGNVTISATTIAKSATVFTPTIFLPDARVFASTIAKVKTMVTPTVTASATVAVGTKAMSVTVPLPTIMMIEFGDIPLYRVETRLRNGTYVADMPYKNLQFELGWNKAYGIRFEVPMDHPLVTPATLEPGLHEVWVWRNGTVITAGPLWDATVSSESRSISCGAMSLLDYLDVRLIDNVEYNVVAQTTIAWDLIDNSQALTDGNLNIIAGTLSAGVTRSAKWIDFDNKYILEALQDMSDMDQGFDFYIDPATRAFTALYPRPQRDIGLQLTYPHQIRRYSLQIMGKWIRNRVRVTGQDPNYATAVDTSSRSYYGLRDYADSYRDAATVTDLTAFASKVRDKRALPRKYPTCVIDVTDINIFNTNIIKYGDVVRILINDGYTQFDQDMRYITAQVTVDKQGMETVVLYLQDTRELE